MAKNLLFFSFFILFSVFANGQSKALDTKTLDRLLDLKKEMIKDHDIKSFYTIQLFSGKKMNAEDIKEEYDLKNYPYKAIIEFETPNYKVWVGMFRTKLNADKAYSEISKDYPNALVFRPGR